MPLRVQSFSSEFLHFLSHSSHPRSRGAADGLNNHQLYGLLHFQCGTFPGIHSNRAYLGSADAKRRVASAACNTTRHVHPHGYMCRTCCDLPSANQEAIQQNGKRRLHPQPRACHESSPRSIRTRTRQVTRVSDTKVYLPSIFTGHCGSRNGPSFSILSV
jgi:hypothetical protein